MSSAEGFFIVVCIEECTRDINCGNVASLMGIDGGSDHNAVSGNCGGGTVFPLVSGLTSFLASTYDPKVASQCLSKLSSRPRTISWGEYFSDTPAAAGRLFSQSTAK